MNKPSTLSMSIFALPARRSLGVGGSTFFLTLALAFAPALHAENLKTVDDFRAAAAKANAVLTVPDWEQTPEAVDAMVKNAIAAANKALDQIGAQDLSKVTFKSTVVALDDLNWEAGNAAGRAVVIKESSPNERVRATA